MKFMQKYFIKLLYITLGTVVVTLSVSFLIPVKYKSEALLAIVDNEMTTSSALSDLGGIARLAGVNLGSSSGGIQKNALIIETVKSKIFLESLILKYDFILPSLLATKNYDSNSVSIIFNKNLYDNEKYEWIRDKKKYKNTIPSIQEAHDLYIKILDIYQFPKTGFISLSVVHESPYFAKRFIEIIIKETNNNIKYQDQKKARDALNFLSKESLKEEYKPIEQSINNLAMQNMSSLMMTEIKTDYVLQVIDSPYVPENPTGLTRFMLFQISIILGVLLSTLSIYFNNLFNYTLKETDD